MVCEPRVATQFVLCHTLLHTFRDCYMLWCVNHELLLSLFCITSHSATHVQRLLHVVVCEPRVATQFVLCHTLLHTFRDCYMLWCVNHELLLSLFCITSHSATHVQRLLHVVVCEPRVATQFVLYHVTLCYTRSETATCCGV